jgi:hypothetical protein
MTTFQDPPLHSRRAARQGERNAAYGQQPDETAEPLTYTTQNRAPLPQYDGPDFRAARTPESPTGEPEQPAAESSTRESPKQEAPSYRRRDYSPEGRRAMRPEGAPESVDGRVDYHTQARSAVPVPTPQESAPAAQPEVAPIVEHTMTRRELRALREAGLVGPNGEITRVPTTTAPAAPVADEAVVEASATEAHADGTAAPLDSPAEVRAVEVSAVEAPTAEEAPTESVAAHEASVAPQLSPFEALFAAPSTQEATPVEEFEPDPIAPAAETAPEVAPESVVLVEPVPPVTPAVEAEVVESLTPVAPVTPTGHWSTQSDLDEATQVNESTISRNVGGGSGVITTSALVLPSLPSAEYAQLGTGEILVTGSIDLPHSLATSGAHPTQLDEHQLDHELDPGDHQVVSTDSQPVRAIKAVSSHTSTRNVIVAKKPAGNRALTVLIVSAAAMAAVVVTLLVVGLVSGVL